jgi:uncharacterized protein
MQDASQDQCTAFDGMRRIASGRLAEVAVAVRSAVEQGAAVLIFDDRTSEPVELDLRGSDDDVLKRLAIAGVGDANADSEPRRGPGRPRLGVVAREVTLLPRHWEWLGSQPGGASVALRKLVEAARRDGAGLDRARQSQNASYKFMSAIGGDLPGFEDASRALFAGERDRFEALLAAWPADIRDHVLKLAAGAFAAT